MRGVVSSLRKFQTRPFHLTRTSPTRRTKKMLLVLVLLTFFNRIKCDLPQGVYEVPLDADGKHRLYWSLDYRKLEIKFESHVKLKENQFFALGFSDYGTFENGDYCVFYPDRGNLEVQDISTDDKCLISFDERENCRNFAFKMTPRMTKISFTRLFDTCDEKDYKIEDGTTHLVWMIGYGFKNGRKLCGQTEEGMVRTQLLKTNFPNPELPPTTWTFSATSPKINVPDSDTTYWCHLVELPPQLHKKQHIVKFESTIQKGNEGLVHHMELFHCETTEEVLPDYSGPCEQKPKELEVCKKVMAAWAMGATPFYYPEEAGLLVGGKDYSKYAMLEVHYNNPSRKSDWVDSSGMKVYMTPDLRRFDAGVVELGLEYIDKMAIPPGQKEFVLSGYCIAECTAVALPPQGIVIFGSQLHTHLTGVKVETRHVRNGMELSKLNYDNHYSTHFQEIRLLKKQHHILPGDSLVTSCTYNTVNRSNITLGGFAITDEMCVNYVYYYPKMNLEVCKSSISDSSLGDYFENLRELEFQKTGRQLPISESYTNIQWNPIRVKVLENLYFDSTIYMQCNQSNGERYPGNWETMDATRIQIPLHTQESSCENVYD